MGRLFWSFDRAMKTDCLVIAMGLEGQDEFLHAFFGPTQQAAPKAAKEPELPPLTPASFRAMFRKAA